MTTALLSIVLLIAVLAAISFVFTYFRAAVLASPDQISTKGLVLARRDTAIFYAFVAVLVGAVGYVAFQAMVNASPEFAQTQFLLLALGLGVVLEIAGAVVFRMRGIVELTLLHLLFIAAYGWLLPRLFGI